MRKRILYVLAAVIASILGIAWYMEHHHALVSERNHVPSGLIIIKGETIISVGTDSPDRESVSPLPSRNMSSTLCRNSYYHPPSNSLYYVDKPFFVRYCILSGDVENINVGLTSDYTSAAALAPLQGDSIAVVIDNDTAASLQDDSMAFLMGEDTITSSVIYIYRIGPRSFDPVPLHSVNAGIISLDIHDGTMLYIQRTDEYYTGKAAILYDLEVDADPADNISRYICRDDAFVYERQCDDAYLLDGQHIIVENGNWLLQPTLPGIEFVNYRTQEVTMTPEGSGLSLSPDREYMYTSYYDPFNRMHYGTIHKVSTEEGSISLQELHILPTGHVGWSTDSKYMVGIYQISTWTETHEYMYHDSEVFWSICLMALPQTPILIGITNLADIISIWPCSLTQLDKEINRAIPYTFTGRRRNIETGPARLPLPVLFSGPRAVHQSRSDRHRGQDQISCVCEGGDR